MYNHPQLYLNGTAPLNITSCVNACVYKENGTVEACTNATGTAVDSFLWCVTLRRLCYRSISFLTVVASFRSDELHPSEQAYRITAREIATLVETGRNRWATWLS